jgi:hypothetical protein
VTWDLSQPVRTFRPLLLNLDPLGSVRAFVAEHGTGALVSRHVVPPLPTGQLTVTVTANLPPLRLGVLRLGVELIAAPRPAVRPQQSRAEGPLDPPSDTATLRLRLAPAEPEEYESVAYAVVPGGGNEPLRGQPVPQQGRTVRLNPADFPVAFVPVRADPALLATSTVRAVFVPADPALPPQEAELDRDQPAIAFTQPQAAGPASLTLHVLPRDGAAPVRLGPVDAVATFITLAALPGYGPQQVTVTAAFPAGEPAAVLAVDLIPEGRPDDPSWITTLALTPDRPARAWRYLPESPFRPGYRWRRYRNAIPPEAWSDVLSPGTPLTVVPGAAAPSVPR